MNIVEIWKTKGMIAAINAAENHPRELRLFAVRCARAVQHLLKDKRSLDAIDVAERYANGQATDEELDDAFDAAIEAGTDSASEAAWSTVIADAKNAAATAAWLAAQAVAQESQGKIFTEVFNNMEARNG